MINHWRTRISVKREKSVYRVDFHAHIIPENFPNLDEKYGDNRFPTLKHTCDCGAEIYKDGKSFRKLDDNAWDPEKRIAQMDEEGIDVQVLITNSSYIFLLGRC